MYYVGRVAVMREKKNYKKKGTERAACKRRYMVYSGVVRGELKKKQIRNGIFITRLLLDSVRTNNDRAPNVFIGGRNARLA